MEETSPAPQSKNVFEGWRLRLRRRRKNFRRRRLGWAWYFRLLAKPGEGICTSLIYLLLLFQYAGELLIAGSVFGLVMLLDSLLTTDDQLISLVLFLVAAWLLYACRVRFLRTFGMVEIVFGIGAFLQLTELPASSSTVRHGAVGVSVYIVIRGLVNVYDTLERGTFTRRLFDFLSWRYWLRPRTAALTGGGHEGAVESNVEFNLTR